ncbi:hypothetical protein GUJ93_ZPchr0008g13600 [Zizania palustris]|uniref:Uncharacterized protein n=1 Tax=Zizania palustris TaxID=103762 RepID=A0A8J5VK14_ZIZPA|nr:hypothetical protein GUJ93_ZPchr0008g13600 [Zizania palustris]
MHLFLGKRVAVSDFPVGFAGSSCYSACKPSAKNVKLMLLRSLLPSDFGRAYHGPTDMLPLLKNKRVLPPVRLDVARGAYRNCAYCVGATAAAQMQFIAVGPAAIACSKCQEKKIRPAAVVVAVWKLLLRHGKQVCRLYAWNKDSNADDD